MKIIKGIVFMLALLNVDVKCMKKLMERDYFQQKVALVGSDAEVMVEKWKIFESIVLSKQYCSNQQKSNIHEKPLRLLCDFSAKELKMYSEVLDCSPGLPFKKYVASLSPKKRAMLITMAGQYDERANKNQLYVPGLTAQLADACLPCDIQEHIDNYLGKDEIIKYMIHKKIAYDSFFLPRQYYAEGSLDQVFSSIDKDHLRNAYVSDALSQTAHRIMSDVTWHEYCSCQLDEEEECFITDSVPCEGLCEGKNSRTLRDTFLLWHKNVNGNANPPLLQHHRGEITSLCMSGQRKIFASSAVKNDKNTIRLWKCTGELLHELPSISDGRVVQLVFINDADELLINFLSKDTSLIKTWNIIRLDTPEATRIAYRPGNDFFCYAIIDPDLVLRGDLVAAFITYYDHVMSIGCWKFYEDKDAVVDKALNINNIKKTLYKWRLGRYMNDSTFKWLNKQSSCFLMCLIRRLFKADRGKKKTMLYQQEPAYKMLRSLPAEKDCNLQNLLQQCFTLDMISDKKSHVKSCVLI